MTDAHARADYVRPKLSDYPYCLSDDAWLKLRQTIDSIRAIAILSEPVFHGIGPDVSSADYAAMLALIADQLEAAAADHRYAPEFSA